LQTNVDTGFERCSDEGVLPGSNQDEKRDDHPTNFVLMPSVQSPVLRQILLQVAFARGPTRKKPAEPQNLCDILAKTHDEEVCLPRVPIVGY
jgi:hypothetical protein